MPRKEVHVRRWQVGAAFVALTLVFVLGILRVQHDAASIKDLQKTNCGLYRFLITAEQTRRDAAARETGRAHKQDLEAAAGYKAIADRFTPGIGSGCPRSPLAPPPPTRTTPTTTGGTAP